MDSSTETGSGHQVRRYVEYEEVWDNLDQLSINRAEMDDNNPYNPVLIIDWHLLEQYIAATPEDFRSEWWLGFLADAARRLGGKLRDFEGWQSGDLLLVALTAYRFNRRHGESVKLLAVPIVPPARRGVKSAPIEKKRELAQLRIDNPDKPLYVVARDLGVSERQALRWLKELAIMSQL
jgi:hypothetical protein